MKIQNNKTKTAVIMMTVIAIGGIVTLVALGMTFVPQPAMTQAEHGKAMTLSGVSASLGPTSYVGGVPLSSVKPHLRPPQTFSITVNGHPEVTTFAVKRGQTAQFDVLIAPMISGITGNVYVHSIKPVCGTINVAIGCIPSGITASLSENTVSNAKHLVLTMTVPANMPVGRYGYEITTESLVKMPYQDTPIHDGYIDSFGIQVT